MSQRPTLCLLGLLLALSVPPVMAQQLSDSERAKRDAAKVFNFIKFHAVRAKSAPVAAAAPAAAVAAAAARPRAEPAAEPAARPSAEASAIRMTVEPVAVAAAPVAAATVPVAALADTQPGTTLPPVSEPAAQPAAVTPAPQPEPEPEPVEIKLIHHVQPELPRGNSLRDGTVRVRFTVEPDGRVSKAAAADGAQRRLANAATRAIEQWRFAPIPEAQEIEVDIDFRFE